VPEYLAPGVYVEETSFRAKSIEGVGTSTTAFIGATRKGPLASDTELPEILTSFADFERLYGGYANLAMTTAAGSADPLNYLAHAARAYFNEGGSRLYVARLYRAPDGATGRAQSAHLGAAAESDANRIRFVARFSGAVGNGRIGVREIVAPAPAAVLNAAPVGSLAREAAVAPFTYFIKAADGWHQLDAGGTPAGAVTPVADIDTSPRLITLAVIATDADDMTTAIDDMGYDPRHPRYVGQVMAEAPARRADAVENMYALRLGTSVNARALLDALFPAHAAAAAGDPRTNEHPLSGGADGREPEAADYDNGFRALVKLEDIAIVAAPGSTAYAAGAAIQRTLISHAEGRRMYRIAVLDTARGLNIGAAREARAQVDSRYAAMYYPWVVVANPNARPGNDLVPKEIALPPSGFVCGIYARNDIERGVFKAPANEVVRAALRFEREISFGEQEVLNPLGLNCLRYFAGRGYRVWGGRTISSDPEWKYVNVRRYFNYLEASIDRSTQWAVFEPNGERLWANIRQTVASFLYNEWFNGALLGAKPEEAYFVKCDRSTMTQNDLDNGRLVCLVGVAALKPAEFVIFRIGQKTADARQ